MRIVGFMPSPGDHFQSRLISPHNADYTRQYSGKSWVRMPFTEAEITSNADYKMVYINQ